MTPETQTARARDLRRRQTRAEATLWQYLRASRLDGLRFRRQHPIDRYFVDFACESLKLVIELDGRIHDEDDQQLYDYHRQREIEVLGWSVLRFTNDQVTGALPAVLDAIRNHARLAGASISAEADPLSGGASPAPVSPVSNLEATLSRREREGPARAARGREWGCDANRLSPADPTRLSIAR